MLGEDGETLQGDVGGIGSQTVAPTVWSES